MILLRAAAAFVLSVSYLPIARIAPTCAAISFFETGLFAMSINASRPSASLDSPSASAALLALSTERGLASSTSVNAAVRNGSALSQLALRPDFS